MEKRQFWFLSLLLTLTLLIIWGAVPANAQWTYCLKDSAYVDSFLMNLEPGNVLRGQATIPSPNPSYPAPLTGHYNPAVNTASFTIGFKDSNASRHYYMNFSVPYYYTWGILSDTTFYDPPREASISFCTPPGPTEASEGPVSAPE